MAIFAICMVPTHPQAALPRSAMRHSAAPCSATSPNKKCTILERLAPPGVVMGGSAKVTGGAQHWSGNVQSKAWWRIACALRRVAVVGG
jgi:hypothetical protein